MMGWNPYGYGYGMMGGGLWMLLELAVLVLLIYLLVRIFSRPSGGSEPKQDRALEILRERFARGEIDQESYERMKGNLR